MSSSFEDGWNSTLPTIGYGEQPSERTGPSGASNNVHEGNVAPDKSNGLEASLQRQADEQAVTEASNQFRASKKGEVAATAEDAARVSTLRQALQRESPSINPTPELSPMMRAKLDTIMNRIRTKRDDQWDTSAIAKDLVSTIALEETPSTETLATAVEAGLIERDRARQAFEKALAVAKRHHDELLHDTAARERAAFEAYQDSLNPEERRRLAQNLAAALNGLSIFNQQKSVRPPSALPDFDTLEIEGLLANLQERENQPGL